MNISKDGISTSDVKSYALQATVGIVMITIPVSIAISVILNMFELGLPSMITNITAFMAGLSLTSYFFLKKILGAMAHDATRRGITEELYNEFKK